MAADVSIIVPVWNGAAFIRDAIQSALAQHGVAVEVVIVDDCSTDDTVEVVRGIDDPRVLLIEQDRNGGPGQARNAGFAAATGTWIAVLDADDAMEPHRLQTLLGFASSDAEILADNLLMVPAMETMFSGRWTPTNGVVTLPDLLASDRIFASRWSLGYLKPLLKRDFIIRHQLHYPVDVRIGEDFIFLAECLAAGGRMYVTAAPLYRYSIRQGSISARTTSEHIEAMIAAQAKLLERRPVPEGWKRAFHMRRRSLERGLAYLLLVDDLKRRDLLTALLLMYLPVRARLKRLLRLTSE
jgi:succinoglycan biosynthesis protein ExoO